MTRASQPRDRAGHLILTISPRKKRDAETPPTQKRRNAETQKRRNSESRPSLPRSCLRPGCVGLGCRVLAELRQREGRGWPASLALDCSVRVLLRYGHRPRAARTPEHAIPLQLGLIRASDRVFCTLTGQEGLQPPQPHVPIASLLAVDDVAAASDVTRANLCLPEHGAHSQACPDA
jgi:hypothetical protein